MGNPVPDSESTSFRAHYGLDVYDPTDAINTAGLSVGSGQFININVSGTATFHSTLTIPTNAIDTVKYGTLIASGNTSTTIYTISHGIAVPVSPLVVADSPQARGTFDVSGGSGLITVTYPLAPASGNVILSWSVLG